MWDKINVDPQIVLKRVLKNGGDFADLFVEDLDSTAILYEAGRVDNIVGGMDRGAGIRVVVNGKTIYAYTNDLTEKGLLELADQLAAAAKQGRQGELGALKKLPPGVTLKTGVDPAGASLKDKIDYVKRANDAAWQSDLVKQVRVMYRDKKRSLGIANSHGAISDEEQQSLVFFTQVVASDGTTIQTGYEPVGAAGGLEILEETTPEDIAKMAGTRALQNLKARKAPAGTMPVVLSAEAGGTMVHEAVGHGLEADLADQGMSVYADKLGQKVASDLITVIDDGTLDGRRGSYGYDDEGTPSKRNVLIENGILKSYMYDKLMSMRKGVESTGNGRRESYRHKPIVRMTNTYIAPGEHSPDEILRSVPDGLFVKKMGGGQVNTVNGDFVFEVTEGYMIKNGEIAEPVRGATLTGNGPKVLQQIDMVGNDLGFAIGTCGKDGQGVPVTDAQPTTRIPEMVVGGSE